MSATQFATEKSEHFLRRREAAAYLQQRYGVGSASTLAKQAMTGDGPRFHKYGGRVVLYLASDLDTYMRGRITARTSTSDSGA